MDWWEEIRYFVSITLVGLIAEYARRRMPPPPPKDEEEDT